jgi:hypothetical protein
MTEISASSTEANRRTIREASEAWRQGTGVITDMCSPPTRSGASKTFSGLEGVPIGVASLGRARTDPRPGQRLRQASPSRSKAGEQDPQCPSPVAEAWF